MSRIAAKITLIITLVVSLWYFLSYDKKIHPFYGDALGYYMYLPSTFIYHNHKALDWLPQGKHIDYSVRVYVEQMRAECPRTPKGYIIDKYTYGVAALEAPFFFTVHGLEKLMGRPANGYSHAYAEAIKLSSILYTLLGLILVYRILNFFFSKDFSLLGTCVLFIGSNLFWFTLYQAGMSHVPLFFLYALLIYVTILMHRQPKTYLFLIAGFTAGLITIIRPTDGLCLLIPLLYNVYSKETVWQKLAFFKANVKRIVLAGVVFVIPLIPQMIYWKKFAGKFLYYSYTNEHFDWHNPKIMEGLFGFANGWLAYSPAMAFGVIGILCYKKIKPFLLPLLILLPAYIYVIYCWYCFNYINGLGSRPMLHMYPILAIPMTALIARVWEAKFYWKAVTGLLMVFFISVNVCYSIQQANHILFSEESNKTYNLHMLFKTKADYNDLLTCDVQQVQPDSNNLEKVATLGCENYEDSLSDRYERDTTGKSRYVYHMHNDDEYHPKNITVYYNKQQFKDARWLRCSGDFMCKQHYSYFKHMFTVEIKRGDNAVSWVGVKIDNKIGLTEPNADPQEFNFVHCELDKWGHIYYYYRIPPDLKDGDRIRLDVWNIGKQELYMDNICLELYRSKTGKY